MDMLTITNNLRESFRHNRPCFFCQQTTDHPFDKINSIYALCLKCYADHAHTSNIVWLRQNEEDLSETAGCLPVTCLFSYDQVVKEAVHAAKIASSYHHIRAWQELLCRRLDGLLGDGQSFYAVMPSPSSLWSRMRGRADLAWFLAREIHRRFGIPMLSAPFHLHWRYQKQATRKGRQSQHQQVKQSERAYDKKTPCLLLIDDVLTSGGTMLRLREALPEHEDCYGLVLAKA